MAVAVCLNRISMVIWKATLAVADTQKISVPQGARFLCAREQQQDICVWFACDPTQPSEQRTLLVLGTGHATRDLNGCSYIGTASLLRGGLIFHVFEKVEP